MSPRPFVSKKGRENIEANSLQGGIFTTDLPGHASKGTVITFLSCGNVV